MPRTNKTNSDEIDLSIQNKLARWDLSNDENETIAAEVIGLRLKRLRLLRNKTQTRVAKKINVTFQQLQKYERGRNRISASKLWLIAQELDAPVQWFFTDAGEGKSPAAEFGTKRETLELVRNFMNMPAEARQHFLSLIKSV